MKSIVDVNLGESFSYNNWFVAFVKVNNLLNSKYQQFDSYQVQRLNILVGAVFAELVW